MTYEIGDPGHIDVHVDTAADLASLASDWSASLTLPDAATIGAAGHVDDHNLIADALAILAAIPNGDLRFITSATGTGVASLSVNGCFSSAYTHYLVMRDLSGTSANQNLNVRLRAAGVDASSADYRYQYLAAVATSVSAARATAQSSAIAALGYTETGAFGFSRTWISNPFEAVRTTLWPDAGYDHDGNTEMWRWFTSHDLSTSYDGFTVTPTGGTITGTVYVYGLAV